MSYQVKDAAGATITKRAATISSQEADHTVLVDANGLEIGSRLPILGVFPSTVITLAGAASFAIGQLIGGSASANAAANRLQFANVAPAGGIVRISRARLYKLQTTLAGGFRLWLFRGDPQTAIAASGAAIAAGTAIGRDSASATRLVGRIDFDGPSGIAGSDGAMMLGVPVDGERIVAGLASGQTDLFGALECRSPYSGALNETFQVVLETE